MKVKCFVDRFKNFEISSSSIRNNYDRICFKKKKKKKKKKKMGLMNYAINVDPISLCVR